MPCPAGLRMLAGLLKLTFCPAALGGVAPMGSDRMLAAGNGLAVSMSPGDRSLTLNVTLDGTPWLRSPLFGMATYFGAHPVPAAVQPIRPGGGWNITWKLPSSGRPLPWTTSVMAGPVAGSVVFRQTFSQGIARTAAEWPAPAPPPGPGPSCPRLVPNTDQVGGAMCCGTPNRTGSESSAGFRCTAAAEECAARCCDQCHRDPHCDAYVTENGTAAAAANDDDPSLCWLIAGAGSGGRGRPGRNLGRIPGRGPPPTAGGGGGGGGGDQDAVLAGWPVFEAGAETAAADVAELLYLGWGGCQLSPGHGQDDVGTHVGRWTGGLPVANSAGMTPFLLYDNTSRSLMVSPAENFFVGIHSTVSNGGGGSLQAGIKASVLSIPAGRCT
eukprot:SAG22_NODE_7_length_40155_cov_25.241356_40_plen_384_part_00